MSNYVNKIVEERLKEVYGSLEGFKEDIRQLKIRGFLNRDSFLKQLLFYGIDDDAAKEYTESNYFKYG